MTSRRRGFEQDVIDRRRVQILGTPSEEDRE